MKTRPITVSFIVDIDGDVTHRLLLMDWIECDDGETIAEDIKGAILNIE